MELFDCKYFHRSPQLGEPNVTIQFRVSSCVKTINPRVNSRLSLSLSAFDNAIVFFFVFFFSFFFSFMLIFFFLWKEIGREKEEERKKKEEGRKKKGGGLRGRWCKYRLCLFCYETFQYVCMCVLLPGQLKDNIVCRDHTFSSLFSVISSICTYVCIGLIYIY